MSDNDIIEKLSDIQALAGTMYAEAAGDWHEGESSVEERVAVGCVVRNRLPRYKEYGAKFHTYKSICLAPKQFSCWIQGSGTNHSRLMAQMEMLVVNGEDSLDPVMIETIFLAAGVMGGEILDCTDTATSYYAPKAMVPRGRVPQWAIGKDAVAIGSQLFFKV